MAGPILYRDLEVSVEYITKGMTAGLAVEPITGYRHLPSRRRNTMRPLLGHVRRLSIVFTDGELSRGSIAHLAEAFHNVKHLRLYFGQLKQLGRTGSPRYYRQQAIFPLLVAMPGVQDVVCSFHPRNWLDSFGEESRDIIDVGIDNAATYERTYATPITLIIGDMADKHMVAVPKPFRPFHHVRIVIAQRAIEADIDHGRPLTLESARDPTPERYYQSLGDIVANLGFTVDHRLGKRTEIYLLDDLVIDSQLEYEGAGVLHDFVHDELRVRNFTPADHEMFKLKTRKEFLAECPGVLDPKIEDEYRWLEGTPRGDKVDPKPSLRTGLPPFGYMYGEWSLTR